MARVAFPLVLQSPSTGSAIVGATATITQHVVGGSLGSGSPATIFTSETGAGTTTTNQITTDNLGRWTQGAGAGYAQYWLPEGTYDIVISGSGLTGFTITRELSAATGVEHLANRAATVSLTANVGDRVLASPGVTITLPAPATAGANAKVQVYAISTVTGASPVTVAGSSIQGAGLSSATSFLLGTPGAFAELVSDGTNWNIVGGQQDTGWVALALASGIAQTLSTHYAPSVRLEGDTVRLSGTITNQTGIGNPAIATVPSSMKPVSHVGLAYGYPSALVLEISHIDGSVNLEQGSWPNATVIYLDGQSYRIS